MGTGVAAVEGPGRDRNVAQQRVDRIHAFQTELDQLQRDGLLVLSAEQQRRLTTHHSKLLRELGQQFDVDTTSGQKQMSLGMRIVSFLGALALAASVFLFFYRIWGLISTPVQLLILICGPVFSVLAMEWTRKRERSPYFTSLAGLVAFAAFVLNLHLLGSIFNITPSPNAFLVWGVFAFLLAYTHDLRLLLVAGILCVLTYLSAWFGTWRGVYWLSFGERPENFLPAGFLLFLVPAVIRHQNHPDLRLPDKNVETLYQLFGFGLAGLTIWVGVRWGWPALTNLGGTFFVIDLYTKFYDWWWEWMPKYLFFLTLGLVAILLLMIFKRLRSELIKESLA